MLRGIYHHLIKALEGIYSRFVQNVKIAKRTFSTRRDAIRTTAWACEIRHFFENLLRDAPYSRRLSDLKASIMFLLKIGGFRITYPTENYCKEVFHIFWILGNIEQSNRIIKKVEIFTFLSVNEPKNLAAISKIADAWRDVTLVVMTKPLICLETPPPSCRQP